MNQPLDMQGQKNLEQQWFGEKKAKAQQVMSDDLMATTNYAGYQAQSIFYHQNGMNSNNDNSKSWYGTNALNNEQSETNG